MAKSWNNIEKRIKAIEETTTEIGIIDENGAIDTPEGVDAKFYDYKPQGVEPSLKEGRSYYDNSAKSITLMTDISSVRHNLGQEFFFRVLNNTGLTITNGQVVYINGSSGGIPTVALSKADAVATSKVSGLATHDIPDGTEGFITHVGDINDVNTASFSPGDTLYLSASVAGAFTNTPPANKVLVGTVLVSNATTGKVSVTIRREVEEELPRSYVSNGNLNFINSSSISIGVSGVNSQARDSTNTYNIIWNGTITIDITALGVNGLDTGSEASSTWYAVFVIADSTEVNPVAGLLSTSSTSPTLPSGYNKFRRLGWIRNNSSSDIIDFFSSGGNRRKFISYQDSIGNRQVLNAGSATLWTTISVASFAPPTARIISISVRNASIAADAVIGRSNSIALYGILAGNEFVVSMFPCTATQTIQYVNLAAMGSLSIWIAAYIDEL